MASDYYALLGVGPGADGEEIKRAYRRLARELHPDTNPDPAATERFKEIAVAYETLRDPERRRRYDTFGPEGAAGGMGGGDPFGGGLNDIFDAFFGSGGSPFGGGRGGGGRGGPPRGSDMELAVEIDFTEAIFGVTREVTIRQPVGCDTCEATGARAGTTASRCGECGGSGQVQRVRQSILGQMVTAGPCPRCGGLGETVADPCPDCRGEGRRTAERTYTVEIPAGVDDGSTLRLTGRGAAGPRGGPKGDLYVHLRVRPHDRFQRAGADLVHELGIPVTQAALGAHLSYETLDGTEDLVIPAGTQTGRVFRLRGRGVPLLDGRGRGDLLVQVVVETPTDLDQEEADLLRRLAELRGDEVAEENGSLLSKIRSAFK
ncbi:MAG TPA: molecular chaperone DnaJ [Acidimicrobiales bacterium]|nr:molecular chaperone DnaJ [Acidimicrobiales bacterium]